jgi:hypothetical protein
LKNKLQKGPGATFKKIELSFLIIAGDKNFTFLSNSPELDEG